MRNWCKIKIGRNNLHLVNTINNIKDDMDDDDNEGEKILTIEDFKKRALEKLEVIIYKY